MEIKPCRFCQSVRSWDNAFTPGSLGAGSPRMPPCITTSCGLEGEWMTVVAQDFKLMQIEAPAVQPCS